MKYNFTKIEKKWQEIWNKNQSYKTSEEKTKPKYYVLDMFPYPSGSGLHVGHPEGYTATDIIARYKKMKGFNVLHPMGWDAFGLPAERYAMQTRIHPSETTKKNIENFKRQLNSLGFSYDWDLEINTTNADYYKWTQWIFLKIFNSYYDKELDKARDIKELKIPDGLSDNEKENYINSRRLAYIAEMPVNWCAELGTVLANEEVDEWVSKGYKVERKPMRQWMLRITAFAERLLNDLEYVNWPHGTIELQKNWIGKSVGAQIKFATEIDNVTIEVFTTRPDTLFGVSYMVLAPENPMVGILTTTEKKTEVEEYIKETSLKSEMDRQLEAEKGQKSGVFTGGYAKHPFTNEKLPIWIADYVLMSYGTGAVMAVPAHDQRDFEFAKLFNQNIKTVIVAEGTDETEDLKEAFTEAGINVNSDFLNGLKTDEAKNSMIQKLEEKGVGESKVHYRLRDWLFSRQRYWGEPIPVSTDENGSYVTESELPLLLPDSQEFQPADTGESPLANLPDWVNHFGDDGRKLTRETNTMPQWAGSSWYYLRFADPNNSERLISPEAEKYWMGKDGVDLYVGGAEHAVLHLLYARFWHKLLYDYGHVSQKEPFKKLVHQGLILGEDGSKMSKSKGNVVNPDDVVSEYGADSFRLFEMFMGPLEQMKPWSSRSIEGVYRFLTRVWRLYVKDDGQFNADVCSNPSSEGEKENDKILHQTIKKVTEDIESLSFNTGISQLMVFLNHAGQVKTIGEESAKKFLLLLSPYAPHIAEEIWQKMGATESIFLQQWPDFDAEKAKESEIEIVVQVNGKVRDRFTQPVGTDDETLKKKAFDSDVVAKHINGKDIRKVIVVKGRLVNIVV